MVKGMCTHDGKDSEDEVNLPWAGKAVSPLRTSRLLLWKTTKLLAACPTTSQTLMCTHITWHFIKIQILIQ